MRYEFTCDSGHSKILKCGISQGPPPEPVCTDCENQSGATMKRVWDVPRWNMFLTKQESFEWADRVMAGKEKITADYEPGSNRSKV